MSGLKTIIAIMIASIGTQAAAENLDVSFAPDVRFFAACAGRLSAQLEHEWLLQDARSEDTAAARATLLDILEALMRADQGRQVLAWRVDAKMAHAALLTRATFGEDAQDADWALRTAETQLAQCTGLLLS